MNKKIVVSSLAVTVLFAGSLFSVTWEEITKKAQSAYANYDKEIKDMNVKQETRVYSDKGAVVSSSAMTMLKKGSKFRVEMIIGQKSETSTVILNDGKDSWMSMPLMGKKKISSSENQYQDKSDWWKFNYKNPKIKGIEKIDGRDCYAVEFEKDKNKPFTKMWIDSKNFALLKCESPMQDKTAVIKFLDLKKLKDKWEYPYRTEMSVDGKLFSVTVVKELKINQGIQDDMFNPDKLEDKKIMPRATGGFMNELMKKKIPGIK